MLKTYRVKAFEGSGIEALADQTHLIALDIDDSLSVIAAGPELSVLRSRLIDIARIPERERSTFRLKVCDRETGASVMDWVR